MDEEEILRSSLEQSNKIDIGNFFGSPIGGLANRAVLQSNTSLKASTSNLNLIRSLQISLESLRSEVQQITNYILVDKQERSKILQQRKLEEFQREDDIQKGLVRPESAQPRGLEDSLPFFPEARFSEGLTAGMSSIGERQGVAQFQERFVEGSRPFFLGGLVPGFGNADTVNAKLTPGEFIIPKEKVEEVGANPLMNFIRGIGNSIRNFDGRPGSKDFDKVPDSSATTKEIVTYLQNLEKSGASKEEVFKLQKSIFSEKLENSKNARWSNIYQAKIDQSDKYFQTGKFDPEKTGYTTTKGTIYDTDKKDDYFPEGEDHLENIGDGPIFSNPNDARNFLKKNDPKLLKNYSSKSEIEKHVLSDKPGKIIEFKGGVSSGDAIPSNLINEKGEVTGSHSTYENDIDPTYEQLTKGYSTYPLDDEFGVTAKDENKRGLFGAIGGTIDAATGNLTDFDRRGGKPFGLMRGLTGTIDAATGGLTDLDRRGGKPFGLMRGLTGSIDAMTGGLTDLDRRGGKPFGTMRLATGVADAMTRNLFDFDRRGKGEEMTEGFSTYDDDFDDFDDKKLQNKTNQLSMKTTVNPDGSITSKGSGTFIAGEIVRPGEPLSPKQRAAITMNIQMGNTYSPEIMENYKNSGGSPSKEEFDNYEKEKSKSVKPEKEKSKNLTLGERFMNMFRGDKKEKSSQLLSGAPSFDTSISSDDSIKTAAKGIMQPPQINQSETIELPPQIQGGGGGSDIAPSAPSFKPSTPGYTGLAPTKSPIPFIDVISNQYLSVV